ncbi:MAG: DEAD/DEAH box helicase [Firmicutes bacterium]|nr:DEAD/DEAH box helicase [Bacillota bacterium]
MSDLTFAALGCSEPFLSALDRRGFTSPTPVQVECFQPGLEGRDLLVQSRTGSGKTLAFGLPILHRLTPERHPQALILAPTRELAQQVAAELQSVRPQLSTALLVGGLSYMPQLKALHFGAQVIVGTPGRVMDHLERKSLDLSKVSMVVLDECDEMLNMGFLEDVEKILSEAPKARQTYLFSATLPAPIASLAQRFLQNPHRVELSGSGGATQHADIAHTACLIAEPFHAKALVNFLLKDEPASALIFTKRKQEAEDVAEELREAGLAAEHLHGDLAQGTRNRILASFKEGKLRYLVATDVAARGLDVEGLPLVIHMGIPTQLESYIHRSGRTGRAGAKGTSLALVNFKESRILLAWGRRGGLKLDWRPVPSQQEIHEARLARLTQRLQGLEAPSHQALAAQLLSHRDAPSLVAALLSLVQGEGHEGFFIPEPPPKPKADRPRHDAAKFDRPRFDKPRFDKPKFDKPKFDRPKGAAPRKPSDEWKPKSSANPLERPWQPKSRPAGPKPTSAKPARPYQSKSEVFKKRKG